MNKYKVSIIIPVYNMDKFIKECLTSIINQSLKNIEIICIDDCSIDKSSEIINSFVKKDSRFKYIKLEKNSGSGIARNMGISNAKGTFIHFMDPDDFYYNDKVLEKLYFAATENDVNIVAGNMLAYNTLEEKRGIFIQELHFSCSKLYNFKEEYPSCFGYQSFLFKRSLLLDKSIYFPDYLRRQDPVFFLNVMLENELFYGIDEYVYVYRLFYKKISWDERKVIDALKSYIDNFSKLISKGLTKHFFSEFNEFKSLVLENEESFKKNENIMNYYKKVINLISYQFFKERASTNLLEHEKEFINNILNQLKNKKEKEIIIYGFGNIGINIYEKLKDEYVICSIIDKCLEGMSLDETKIVNSISNISNDALVILTVYNKVMRESIIEDLVKKNIPLQVII